MAEEYKGEWKLLKVWECHKCKALIRDGRKVYDHICNQNGDKQEKVVEKVVEKIVEKIVYVESPTVTAPIPTAPTEDIEDENRENVDNVDTNRENVDNVDTNRENVDNVDTENVDNVDTENVDNVDTENVDNVDTNRENVETTTHDDFAFGDETKIEDFISGEAFTSARINPEETERMCLDVWKEDAGSIKDSKDTGYRSDIEIEIFERGKGKKRVIIKNGRVQKKPEGIEIIGKKSPTGFIVQGVIKRM